MSGVGARAVPPTMAVRKCELAGCTYVNDNPRRIDVDEYWLREWAAEGLIQLDRLLERHAAFERYLNDRERKEHENTDDTR